MKNEVAATILNQLGGNKFLAMTGCYNLATNGDDLIMKLRRNASGATHLTIKLNSSDLYDVTFMKCSMKTGIKEVKKFEGVYNDMLQDIFTSTTGLYTSL